MKKIAWITDSTCSLDPEFVKQNDIFVVPMGISFDQETFRDGVDITEEEFYEKLSSSPTLPKSSQPAIGEMVELYETLKKEYDMGIAVHVSSALSGTANASKQAAEIADFQVELVDSKLLSLPMSAMILKGQEMIAEGISPSDVAENLREMATRNELYLTVGSLDQLHKGGRVNSLQMLMGSILQIKPIFKFDDGKLSPHEKVRSKKKALAYMLTCLKKEIEEGVKVNAVYLLHASALDEVASFEDEIRLLLPDAKVVSGSIGSAVGVHAGAGTIGISWFKE